MENKKMKFFIVAGARPNFMKVAPIMKELKRQGQDLFFLHTGQHGGEKMSKVFLRELGIPEPDRNLNIGEKEKSRMKKAAWLFLSIPKIAKIIRKESPDIVIVVGDVYSTLISTIAAKLAGVKVAHIESGLRSFNKKMPEERNRILTDRMSNYLFTTEESANNNLKNEGVKGKVFFAGNVMIDTLKSNLKKLNDKVVLKKLNIKKKKYILLTLHRNETIKQRKKLSRILDIANVLNSKVPVLFPLHPSTRAQVREYGLVDKVKNLKIIEPQGYLDFLSLQKNALMVITDSGGVQEETTVLGVPCLTIREETERPVTVSVGTNTIVGFDEKAINENFDKILAGEYKKGKIPKYWDGKAAKRIVKTILEMRK